MFKAVFSEYVSTDTLHPAPSSWPSGPVEFRTARLADAPDIWRLVKDAGSLELNSQYCYLLLCRDFAQTCVVAQRGAELVGFVVAYRPPSDPEAVFVWQVGVAATARRQGLAKRMLHALVGFPGCREVRFLTATVTPSNGPSRRLFRSFAEDLRVPCQVQPGFAAEMFAGGAHEDEELFRIGPFQPSSTEKSRS